MTDLEKLTAVLEDIGIEYTLRDGHEDAFHEYQYLFFGECRNIGNPDMTFENGNLDMLTSSGHKFVEFENGKLASYSNS